MVSLNVLCSTKLPNNLSTGAVAYWSPIRYNGFLTPSVNIVPIIAFAAIPVERFLSEGSIHFASSSNNLLMPTDSNMAMANAGAN